MRSFPSMPLSPNKFTQQLIKQRIIWRRNMSGAPPHVRKRFSQDLTRQWVQKYRQSTGIQISPKQEYSSASSASHDDPKPEQIKIIIAPPSKTTFGEVDRHDRTKKVWRKSIKRILHDLPEHRFELRSSKPNSRAMLTDSGFLSQDGKIEGTAVLLEEIGAAICPALSPDDIKKIESEGAIVLSNETIELIDSITYDDFGEDPNDTFWHLAHVNASSPHSRGLTGRGALIGILDTGIDLSHTEFSEKQIFFRAFGANGDELSDIPPRDYGKHGTHVSALCAGKRAGVAPDAQLAVAAVLTQRNSKGQMCGTTAQVLRGMNWLIQGGSNLPRPVDIINASLGSRGLQDHYYDRLRDALEIDGIVTIAAIGNNGDAGENNHGSPGNYDTVIGVGAIDSKDTVAGFSDWGTITSRKDGTRIAKPDIVAPGVKVVSAIPGGKYSAASGTSMASPLVAGALALILQKRNGQAWNPDLRVKELLMAIKPGSGKPNHPDHFRRGYGSLDLGEI